MASAIMRSWEHIGYNKNTGTIIAIARKSIVFARSIDFGVTWTDIRLPSHINNTLVYSKIICNPYTNEWLVICMNKNAGMLLSTDDGLTWTHRTSFITMPSSASVDIMDRCYIDVAFNDVNSVDREWIFTTRVFATSASTECNQLNVSLSLSKASSLTLMFSPSNNNEKKMNVELSTNPVPGSSTPGADASAAYPSATNLYHDIHDLLYIPLTGKYVGVAHRNFGLVANQLLLKAPTELDRSSLNVGGVVIFTFNSSGYPSCSPIRSTKWKDSPWYALAYDETERILIGSRGKYIVYSEDGGEYWSKSVDPTMETYDPGPTPIDSELNIRSLAAANGVIIATMEANTDKIYRSIDRGNTWTQITLSEPGLWTVKHCGNRFIMVSFNSNKTARSLTLDEV